jgi:antitoxin CcdA
MALTRNFKQTVIERVERDPQFAKALLDEAANVSQAAEAGLARALAEKRAELWLRDNQSALNSSNDYVDQHGLPLTQYRGF